MQHTCIGIYVICGYIDCIKYLCVYLRTTISYKYYELLLDGIFDRELANYEVPIYLAISFAYLNFSML